MTENFVLFLWMTLVSYLTIRSVKNFFTSKELVTVVVSQVYSKHNIEI